MKVLSLFDGMACGMIAMQIAGVEVSVGDTVEGGDVLVTMN